MKIVQFKDKRYGIRKFSIISLCWVYLDLEMLKRGYIEWVEHKSSLSDYRIDSFKEIKSIFFILPTVIHQINERNQIDYGKAVNPYKGVE